MRKIFYFLTVIAIISLAACKKDKPGGNTDDNSGPPSTGTLLDRIRDSVYLYPKETYLWYDQLPSYKNFQPRNYVSTDTITGLSSEVDHLSQYAINPATRQPYEYYDNTGSAKYSFIDDGSVSSELGGNGGDFGFSVFYPINTDLRVKYVYPGSPADKAGIKRGYQITKINGRTDLTYDYGGATTQFVVNAYAYSKTISMTLVRADNTTMTVNLNTEKYTINPVITHRVIDVDGKRIGYMVFNSFTDTTNAVPQLINAFSTFGGITDLVIDLRYNGGGSVETAEILDNFLVPASKSGTKMYTSYFNDKLTSDNYTLFKNLYEIPKGFFSVNNQSVNFKKRGSLNLSRIFFIVTGGTASASELTINNLIPQMDVKLIGLTTYGKPVGFYNIDINRYQLYMPMFSTRNSANKGDYYSGMTPGSSTYDGFADDDDVTKDFGDTTETLLAHAVKFIRKGTYKLSSLQTQSLAQSLNTRSADQTRKMAQQLEQRKTNGLMLKKPAIFKRKKKQ
jgi:C-terminal processing protease CtpA/Prc